MRFYNRLSTTLFVSETKLLITPCKDKHESSLQEGEFSDSTNNTAMRI